MNKIYLNDSQWNLECLEELPQDLLNLILVNNHVDPSAMKLLIQAGADVEAKYISSRNTLHYAAKNGYTLTIKILLEAGASLEARDHAGWTPLHMAAISTRYEVARILLEAGANKHALDILGRTPWDLSNNKMMIEIPQLNPNA